MGKGRKEWGKRQMGEPSVETENRSEGKKRQGRKDIYKKELIGGKKKWKLDIKRER